MKILLTIFIYLLTAFQSANAGGIPYTFNQKILQGKVIRVLDGDTIEIKTLPAKIVVYEVPIRVRLIKQSGSDPFAAIEAVMPWDTFAASVTEAQTLARPADFDFLHHIGESYATLRRYAPQFLGVLKLRAAPAAKGVLDAIDMLRGMNSDSARKVPADAPTAFIKD